MFFIVPFKVQTVDDVKEIGYGRPAYIIYRVVCRRLFAWVAEVGLQGSKENAVSRMGSRSGFLGRYRPLRWLMRLTFACSQSAKGELGGGRK